MALLVGCTVALLVGCTVALLVGLDIVVLLDCACIAVLLVATLVCHLHEHGLLPDRLKSNPGRHFLIDVITAKTSLLDGFWPLPVNTGRPSAKSISWLAYWRMPLEWCNFDICLKEVNNG